MGIDHLDEPTPLWTLNLEKQAGQSDVPYGYCRCGCGQKTSIAPYSDRNKGWVKGEPKRFLPHHHMRLPRTKLSRRYGRLAVVGKPFVRDAEGYVACRCDCGVEREIRTGALAEGNTRSCGCLRRDVARELFTTHGFKSHPLYDIYNAMLQRCHNPKNAAYASYGGRGIAVCERWRESLAAFVADMGPKPTPLHTLERVDNDGDYAPENCRWTTREEQARNRRTNRFVEHGGASLCLKDWSKRTGVLPETIAHRLKQGHTTAAALGFEPLPSARRAP